jgi:hypothetical protein
MTTGLIIRSYPARGGQARPTTYNSSSYGYFIVCLFPVAITCVLVMALFDTGQKPSWLIPASVVSILALVLSVVFLRALRLEIASGGISYTNPLRGTRSVEFSEMSSVVLIDYRQEGNGAAGINRSVRRWTIVITPKSGTGKPPLSIPLTMFPREAYEELLKLLKPEIWEASGPWDV